MPFLGSWWPTSGYRFSSSATFGGVGSNGNFLSASPYPSSNPYYAYSLTFGSGYVYPVYGNNRSYGRSVRCVQE